MKSTVTTIILSLIATTATIEAQGCWKHAHGRGAGKVITDCHNDEDKNGALCYPKCRDGYHGVGPVCWGQCTNGYKDTGVDCLKPKSYGRGAGYPIWDHKKCNHHHSQGCEKSGALWYPKCNNGFHNVACCVCSPDCPSGFRDIGVSCQKPTYGRSAGKPLHCSPGLEMSGTLCYPPCKAGYHGNGPLCWQECPAGWHNCGAMCTPTSDACTSAVLNIAQNVVETGAEIAIGAFTGEADLPAIINGAGSTAQSLTQARCPQPQNLYIQVQTPAYPEFLNVQSPFFGYIEGLYPLRSIASAANIYSQLSSAQNQKMNYGIIYGGYNTFTPYVSQELYPVYNPTFEYRNVDGYYYDQ
ncbi:UNKNOWN [Stylonychia lemnae]|uniref:Uncharacterized protein n=1 Tax=Stylonychia lemnae TaxID=5949 RepID=A0A078BBM9_STYLE|nr:UNKNOWN [Stylonychia lemnae]|eukprot:CDW91799.1 UNKNOWN [Stylonychia lemnae]